MFIKTTETIPHKTDAFCRAESLSLKNRTPIKLIISDCIPEYAGNIKIPSITPVAYI